jgi:hypothetical protein
VIARNLDLKLGLLAYVALVAGLLWLTSCSGEAWRVPLVLPAQRPDTVVVPTGTSIGKLKAGTVILQAGTGNSAEVTDNRKAGQRGGAAATAPAAQATATTERGIPVAPVIALSVLAVALVVNKLVRGVWLL